MKNNVNSLMDSGRIDEAIELGIVLTITTAFFIISFQYEGAAGQFPRVFLFAATLFTFIQLLIVILPKEYTHTIEAYTAGISESMSEEYQSNAEGREKTKEPSINTSDGDITVIKTFLFFCSMLLGFFLLIYFIGILYSIPFITVSILYFFGSFDYKVVIALSVALMLLTHYFFGNVLNVPINSGVLL